MQRRYCSFELVWWRVELDITDISEAIAIAFHYKTGLNISPWTRTDMAVAVIDP